MDEPAPPDSTRALISRLLALAIVVVFLPLILAFLEAYVFHTNHVVDFCRALGVYELLFGFYRWLFLWLGRLLRWLGLR